MVIFIQSTPQRILPYFTWNRRKFCNPYVCHYKRHICITRTAVYQKQRTQLQETYPIAGKVSLLRLPGVTKSVDKYVGIILQVARGGDICAI